MATGGLVLRVLLLAASASVRADERPPSQEQSWALTDLLGNISEDTFFEQYWQHEPLHAGSSGSDGDSSRAARTQGLLSLAELDALVNSPALDARMQSVVEKLNTAGRAQPLNEWWEPAVLEPLTAYGGDGGTGGEKTLGQIGSLRRPHEADSPPDFATVHEAYLRGATVSVRAVELSWRPVDALTAALAARFECMFTADAFAVAAAVAASSGSGETQAGSGSVPTTTTLLPPRADRQDLFLVQLDGAADWTVYHRPVRDGVPAGVATAQTRELLLQGFSGEPAWKGTLLPGELLYIPRGWVYGSERAAIGQPSLHLVLAANTDSHSVGVFISHLLASLEKRSPQV